MPSPNTDLFAHAAVGAVNYESDIRPTVMFDRLFHIVLPALHLQWQLAITRRCSSHALQGSLSNFAGGVLILLFKPFEVENYIEAQGHGGTVKSIQIFSTTLLTPDNKTIIIPNGELSNGSIINYSKQPTRRVDFIFGIGYGDDIQKAKKILSDIVDKDKRILDSPEPAIKVAELADSSVNLAVRVWCKTSDYWDVFFDMQENVKQTFDKKGISIPFPQMEMHMEK